MVATGRVVVALGAAVVVALLAGGADADCFDYCFKDCIARDRSMVDYCNYACDKTCQPDNPALSRPMAAPVVDIDYQLSCAWDYCHRLRPDGKAMGICFGQCYDGCKTTASLLPRPLRAGAGVHAASWPARSPEVVVLSPPNDVDHHVFATPPDDPDHLFATPPDDPDHA
ncbi:hypothetical protein E2562_008088 [Oryza meyeriana var. granulata]|uniref:Acidic protein n=1 Tax=Oryza meyeriana var. granulata TaxID=110450 RepID=A0A6G1CEM9_9ORYZ|nr:hypothetical protein E2562_008088 [Oryza meyeriana var. granulata]